MPSNRRLLLVEDHDLLREELVSLLEAPHREIVEVDSAEKALARWCEGAFDVVVSDVGLPGRSGLELARELLARRPDQAVVLCTGHRIDVQGLGPNVHGLFKDRIEDQLPALVAALESTSRAGG